MSQLAHYQDRYRNAELTRHAGVLQVKLHTEGETFLWSQSAHEQLPHLFRDIAGDTENRVVILTGTGDAFCPKIEPGNFHLTREAPSLETDRIYADGKDLIFALLDIRVPVIAAVNGPCRHHSELPLLSDVVLVSDTALFQDRHFKHGVVPGDGMHIVLPLLLGMNRGKYHSILSKPILATDALDYGLVSEVLPEEDLLPRAWEIALDLARRPLLGLRYTREVLNLELKRLFRDHLGHGLALEALASGYGAWLEDVAPHAEASPYEGRSKQ